LHELSKDDAMTAKENGVHSKPSMKEFGWWWQKAYLDDIDMDIHEAIMGFRMRFHKEPLHAIIWGPSEKDPITIHNLPVWQDPEVPQNVVVLQ